MYQAGIGGVRSWRHDGLRPRGSSYAFTDALREVGIVLDPQELTTLRGASKYEALRHLLGRQAEPMTARLDHIYACFQADLMARLARAQPLSLPGVRLALERLRAAGIRVAVASGFDRNIVELVLKSVDWNDLLDAQVCSEDVAQGRPAPFMIFRAMERSGVLDVHQVAVVGDTVRDLEAGWDAGVAYRIAVLTGAHDRAALSAGPQTHIVDSVRDVPGLWLQGAA
ncbi:MAG TPA: HAD-IA family hydrolase [Gemmatimonadales bacterium]|nr:HAD-IA family hydrolase [Gemmatimonadales bacterium]